MCKEATRQARHDGDPSSPRLDDQDDAGAALKARNTERDLVARQSGRARRATTEPAPESLERGAFRELRAADVDQLDGDRCRAALPQRAAERRCEPVGEIADGGTRLHRQPDSRKARPFSVNSSVVKFSPLRTRETSRSATRVTFPAASMSSSPSMLSSRCPPANKLNNPY